jgi:hypothetical protein
MSALAQFFLLAAVEIAGLFAIWFLIRARIRRYLELENLLAGVRDESRALVLELNETADRNVTLVEDRMVALRELLAEVDRRIGVERREYTTRENEREVYARLSKRRPIVPESERQAQAAFDGAAPEAPSAPITLNLGTPEVGIAETSVVPARTRREEAIELYRRGFSADIIAARTQATVAEIELLVEMEERRAAGRGSAL